jgi:hypothetical protein
MLTSYGGISLQRLIFCPQICPQFDWNMVDIDGSCEKINNTTCKHLQVVIGTLRNLKEKTLAVGS